MIPVIAERPAQSAKSIGFLDALREVGFEGTIDTSYASRLSASTDNSVYQVVPDAVVFPRHVNDVVCCAKLMARPEHQSVTLVPRGAGTGTNGQSLCAGIVVDLSRNLAEIGEFSEETRTIRVDPGVVLDELNRKLKPHGRFFAPTLSPSNRATLGGMISTNASGKGSRIYGRTADHVVELDVVLVGGTQVTLHEVPLAEAEQRATLDTDEGRLYRTLLQVLKEHEVAIQKVWPNMPRTLTGYDLKSAMRHDLSGQAFVSLIPIVAGSEGTLGFIVGATLRTTTIPQFKRTVALRYAQFDDALSGAETLVNADPAAIETIDSRILELARKDAIWHKVSHLLDGSDEAKAINLIEFVGNDEGDIARKVQSLVDSVSQARSTPGAPIGVVVAACAKDADSLWELRKKGVGLLGALQGERRPIAFVEDTAVPPAKLSAYVKEFRKLLDDAGLIYGMFGHVDVGCLHVRPALDMRDPSDERRLRQISDQVVALVKKYDGVFWGEHGKGFRSEYVPEVFGTELFGALCAVKESFDPRGQLNPGKLAVVQRLGQSLLSIDSPKKGTFDREIAALSQRKFDVAIHCNGNGLCFSTDPDSAMCPSSKLRRDRVHSPKGRASVIREWLRQISLRGVDAAQLLEQKANLPPNISGAILLQLEGHAHRDNGDFSHEVYDALDGCLSCKACATQCPIKVDVPRMKSEFLALYHERYARPLRDFFVASLERMLGVLALAPTIINFALTRHWVSALMRRVAGIVDTPLLPKRGLKQGLRKRQIALLTNREFTRIGKLSEAERAKFVILVQDAFTTFYEPEVVLAAIDVIQKLGKTPLLLPFFPNGKALVVKGFISSFRVLAKRNAAYLNRIAGLGLPMLGLEPAVTLTYRDEYVAAVGTQQVQFRVQFLQEWLLSQSTTLSKLAANTENASPRELTLLGHCTEKTMAPSAERAWEKVFGAVGVTLSIPNIGCCGMCGVFGYEATHVEQSRQIFAMSWQPKLQLAGNDRENYLVSGHSCRSQVHRVDSVRLLHPIQALLTRLS